MGTLNKYQAYAYYLLAAFVLTVMDLRTFAFVDGHTASDSVVPIALAFLLTALLRAGLEPRWIDRQPLLDQPRRQFVFDLSLYVFVGAAIFLYEGLANENTALLAGKLVAAALVIGYFASTDSALNRERVCSQAKGLPHKLDMKAVPASRRLSLFFTITLLMVVLTNTLSAYSYMSLGVSDLESARIALQRAYLIETLFTLGIVVSLTLRLIHSYSLNLQHRFDTQIGALRDIQSGKLDGYVPVFSNDEFGIIAQQTNAMIDELREKEKIRATLQQIVSPDVMSRLLRAEGVRERAEECEVAVLFCDLRKFTAYAENTPPEDVIFFLNAYFSKIADLICEHNGFVNKFMGDAIMAVFPLDEGAADVDDAIAAAWDILLHSSALRTHDGKVFEIGIGLHMGRAAAGTIGSDDRYEYTFIGDTVNTASRLDGLSKRLGYRVIVSSKIYNNLSRDARERFVDLGRQRVRGKQTAVHVYGAAPSTDQPESATA